MGTLRRIISLADLPTDDDDVRLRKRVGVAAGLLTVFAPISLPIQALGHPARPVSAIPASIATRLKHGEDRIAETYPETSVLFADVVGFTPWANRADPDRVIGLLEDLFNRFDDEASAVGIEKLKTMGDAYMAVAGAPVPRDDHAIVAIEAAQRMLAAAADWRETHGVELELRIGLASGPAVGGVIGRRRIMFDLWGDTVNTASRMESSGLAGRIQVAESTMRRASGRFTFEERLVDVKGLGSLTTYFLVP